MPYQKTKGGQFLTTINEMSNLNDLHYSKPYQEFNYDKYMGSFRQSNFAGGGKNMKSLHKTMETMYKDYKTNNLSLIGGYREIFPIKIQEMQNIKDLNFKTPFEYTDIKRIQNVPNSKFGV